MKNQEIQGSFPLGPPFYIYFLYKNRWGFFMGYKHLSKLRPRYLYGSICFLQFLNA